MKILNRTVPAGLAVIMIMSAAMPVSAEKSSQKEEVIYIMTDAEGSVNGVYAVNIFGSGDITDYGKYDSVKMLNTSDKIITNEDKITFSTTAEKAYMQGTLTDTEIPWTVSIRYFIDGKELTAEEIAGKSGSLEIKFDVSRNEKCSGSFYENYALQAAFTLDTDICSNIKAEGATTANVGSDKQISYTILPNKGINASITADVKNFEMAAVSINGVKMNLDIDVDSSELTGKVTELNDGIEKIDDGAKAVSDGSSQLKDGGSSLKNGSAQLTDGAKSLDSGIAKLSSGIFSMQSGLNQLNAQSANLTNGSAQVKSALVQIQSALNSVSADTENLKKMTAASGEIKTAVSNLKSGAEQLKGSLGYTQYKAAMSENGLDIDALSAGNNQAIGALNAQIDQLNETISQLENIPGYEEQVYQLQEQVSQLSEIVRLLTGNNAAIAGTEQYLNALSEGADDLCAGLEQLETSYAEFDRSIGIFADSLSSMLVNVSALSDGVNMLSEKYDTLDGGIIDYTSGVDKIVQGYSQLTEGVSDLAAGSKSLVDGSENLDGGISDLYDGIIEMCDGTDELSDGTGELKDQMSGMDTEIENKIDDVISSMQGSDEETVSFVSENNTNVESVQFVIKTEAIEIPEIETEEIQEEKLNFWQKLLRLFGLY